MHAVTLVAATQLRVVACAIPAGWELRVSKNAMSVHSEMAAVLSVVVPMVVHATLAPVNADADQVGSDPTAMNRAVKVTMGISAKKNATARMLMDVIT